MSNQNSSPNIQPQNRAFQYCYRTVLKSVDNLYDVRGSILAEMVRTCLENRARIPLAQRAYFDRQVQQEALVYLELYTERLLFGPYGRLSPHEYHYFVKPGPDET